MSQSSLPLATTRFVATLIVAVVSGVITFMLM